MCIVSKVSYDTTRMEWWGIMKRINRIKKSSVITSLLLSLLLATAFFKGATDYFIPDSRTIYDSREVSGFVDNINSVITESEATAKIFGVPLKSVEIDVLPKRYLIPCGDIFGVKFFTKGVMIVGMSDIESENGILNPALNAGLRVGDNIISIDKQDVNTIEEISAIINRSQGKPVEVLYERQGISHTAELVPVKSLTEGKYRSGMWVRDSTAGIGTITYYDSKTGKFGGLGHGICDIDTGNIMPMLRGNIVDINVTDIVRGTDGVPGEIKGEFGIIKTGELDINSDKGVFGVLNKKPLCAFDEALEVAPEKDVTEGEAFIYTSLGTGKINKYRIDLTKIYHNDSETKNFIFEVTDEELLKTTGGIVQGMSGSPILQNGKLIGAVTHVLVNDPTKGYGIFIENMLSEAEKMKY